MNKQPLLTPSLIRSNKTFSRENIITFVHLFTLIFILQFLEYEEAINWSQELFELPISSIASADLGTNTSETSFHT